jgi:hypothetical protein
MKYHNLRIAFSAICGISCLLLIALWVRSYGRMEMVACQHGRGGYSSLISSRGRLIGVKGYIASNAGQERNLIFDSQPTGDNGTRPRLFIDSGSEPPLSGFSGFQWRFDFAANAERQLILVIPCWFVVSFIAVCGALTGSSRPYRFSLRTMLIGMTLVARLLGAVVYAVN